ncbi:MAG: CDP-alcohol phosphatidyltransferase family protein [Bacteroidota bacterium]
MTTPPRRTLKGLVNTDPHVVRWLKSFAEFGARVFISVGLTATALTALAFVLGLAGAVLVAMGLFGWAFVLLLVSVIFDAVDGSVARTQGVSSQTGAFLDSTLDRYVDIAIFLGISWYFFEAGDKTLAFVTFAGLIGAVVTSYSTARASSLGVSQYVGPFGRLHRALTVLAGVGLPFLLPAAVWVLAIFGNLTAVNRLITYTKILRQRDADAQTTTAGPAGDGEPADLEATAEIELRES